jgi:ABC-type sugar transport system permease subunit
MLSLVILSVWRWTGYYAVILLAGLQNIPSALYDAARIDGAARWQIVRSVTLPMLSPTIFFVVVIAVMSSFQGTQPMVVRVLEPTNPAPGRPRRILYVLPVEAGADNRNDPRVFDIYNYGQAFGSELDWNWPADQGRHVYGGHVHEFSYGAADAAGSLDD